MGFFELFKTETPQEKVRRYKRGLQRTCRELDREHAKMVAQEKKIQIEMKQMAKKGETDALRIMAKDLVQTRKNAQKMYLMRTQIQGVALHIETLAATNQMTQAMKGVGRAMHAMNKQVKLPSIAKIMQNFEKENEIMAMKDDVMGDAVSDVLDTEGDMEADTELEVQKAIDEAQIDLQRRLRVTPGKTEQKENDLVNAELLK